MKKEEDKKEKVFKPVITFSGAGVLHVKSSDLIQTETVKRQIDALEKMKREGIFAKM